MNEEEEADMLRATSVLINRLTGGGDTMFCARVHTCGLHCMYWRSLEIIIDLVFRIYGAGHCRMIFEKEVNHVRRQRNQEG